MATRKLPVVPVTRENFAPFGEFVTGTAGCNDAAIDLSQGRPRFYVMRLSHQPGLFDRITRHRRVTQCLGALMGSAWWIAVAPPSPAAARADPATIAAFRIPGDGFIRLHAGTWHAGPYFAEPFVDFFNLELADTNETDHDSCALEVQFEFDIAAGVTDQRNAVRSR